MLNTAIVDKCLDKLTDGLLKYLWIQNNFTNINVANDANFQKKFNHFYKIRRDYKWRAIYFKIFENYKNKDPSFEHILKLIYENTGRIEASFSSKLVATINPNMPVIDSVVLGNLGMKIPTTSNDRVTSTVALYLELASRLDALVNSAEGIMTISRFNTRFADTKITDVKILDLVLWQLRQNKLS